MDDVAKHARAATENPTLATFLHAAFAAQEGGAGFAQPVRRATGEGNVEQRARVLRQARPFKRNRDRLVRPVVQGVDLARRRVQGWQRRQRAGIPAQQIGSVPVRRRGDGRFAALADGQRAALQAAASGEQVVTDLEDEAASLDHRADHGRARRRAAGIAGHGEQGVDGRPDRMRVPRGKKARRTAAVGAPFGIVVPVAGGDEGVAILVAIVEGAIFGGQVERAGALVRALVRTLVQFRAEFERDAADRDRLVAPDRVGVRPVRRTGQIQAARAVRAVATQVEPAQVRPGRAVAEGAAAVGFHIAHAARCLHDVEAYRSEGVDGARGIVALGPGIAGHMAVVDESSVADGGDDVALAGGADRVGPARPRRQAVAGSDARTDARFAPLQVAQGFVIQLGPGIAGRIAAGSGRMAPARQVDGRDRAAGRAAAAVGIGHEHAGRGVPFGALVGLRFMARIEGLLADELERRAQDSAVRRRAFLARRRQICHEADAHRPRMPL
ncbi:hypothetical protein [Massilia antarctica]|uniref:hypothetical protein n=1 Tax=Massilia antarctica TaxID=2765360 RepID=UPI0035A69BCA